MTDTPGLFSLVPLTSPEQELPKPSNGPYFVATKTGYMVHQSTHWGHVLVPVKEATSLAPGQALYWHEIELPPEIIGQAWGFFRAVWFARKTEAMVDITWSKEHGYRLFVPPQDCSHGGVHAKRTPEHYKGRIVGTIHSHCDFASYHSGTDTHDADGHDGLHMTIGHVHEDKLDISILLSANAVRWEKIDLKDVVANPDNITPLDPPTWWIGQLDRYKTPPTHTPAPTPNAGHAVTRWHNTQAPAASTPPPQPKPDQNRLTCIHGAAIGDPCKSCNRELSAGDSIIGEVGEVYTTLDALARDLPVNDDRILALDEIQSVLDNVTAALSDLGIDFDYEVEEAFAFSEMHRLNEYFRRLEEQQ